MYSRSTKNTKRCWVPNCSNSKPKVAIKTRLFKFPRNVNRCCRWLEAIGEPSLTRSPLSKLSARRYVCQEHFQPAHITPQGRTAYNAIPQIFTDKRPVLPKECLEEFVNNALAETNKLCHTNCILGDSVNPDSSHPGVHSNTKIAPGCASSSACNADTNASTSNNSYMEHTYAVGGPALPDDRGNTSPPPNTDVNPGAPYHDDPGNTSPPPNTDACPETLHHDSVYIDHDYAVTAKSAGSQIPDSVCIDHGYAVTAKPAGSQTPVLPIRNKTQASSTVRVILLEDEEMNGSPPLDGLSSTGPDDLILQEFAEERENQEDTTCHLVLEDVRKELCRLCGQKGSLLIPIFEMLATQEVPLSLKIEMYLPFKVKMEDPLPSQVCSNCFGVLNYWHELYVSSIAADAVLWKTFGRQSKRTTHNDPDTHIRVEEDVGLDMTTSPEKEAKIQEESILTLPSGETQEEQDLLCTECGKNKLLSIPEEEDFFNEEFDKNFANFRSISYKCSFCYELFKGPPDRKNHVTMCRQLSTICDLCGLKIPCRKDLRRHKYQKHTKKIIQRRYLCDKCDKCLKSAAGLKYHIECAHKKNLSPQYHCELCCTAFVGEFRYRKHKMRHERGLIKSEFQLEDFLQNGNFQDSENVVYSCPVCKETYDDKLSLVVHLTTKKKIKCSACLKVMSCEKHFMIHVCGQWKCHYCLKTFDKKVKWIVHERLHTGEKPFKCRTCDLTFRSYHNRRRHEEHHNPDFKCSYCGKCFRTKYVFQDHVSCHEGKVFSCHICGKTFGGRKYLCKHINKLHKNIISS